MNSSDIRILPYDLKYIDQILPFMDAYIGPRFYTESDLCEIHQYSSGKNGKNCSFLAFQEDQLVGLRFTYAPNSGWTVLFKENKLSPHLWQAPIENVAYFKTAVVHPDHRHLGIGKTMSKMSLNEIKLSGGTKVVAHSWIESPGDSSRQYLKNFGFTDVAEHKHFWSHIDYECILCKKPPCLCNAVEMIYIIE